MRGYGQRGVSTMALRKLSCWLLVYALMDEAGGLFEGEVT